jgi:hypothetical protein
MTSTAMTSTATAMTSTSTAMTSTSTAMTSTSTAMTLVPQPTRASVGKRCILLNGLFGSAKYSDFGNTFYNYACHTDNDSIIQYMESFSKYEKHFVVIKLEDNGKVKNSYIMQNGWGETKIDMEDANVKSLTGAERDKLLDPIFFTEDEMEHLNNKIAQIKDYFESIDNKHSILWFRQRSPIVKTILKSFDEYSHVELVSLYENLMERERKDI